MQIWKVTIKNEAQKRNFERAKFNMAMENRFDQLAEEVKQLSDIVRDMADFRPNVSIYCQFGDEHQRRHVLVFANQHTKLAKWLTRGCSLVI